MQDSCWWPELAGALAACRTAACAGRRHQQLPGLPGRLRLQELLQQLQLAGQLLGQAAASSCQALQVCRSSPAVCKTAATCLYVDCSLQDSCYLFVCGLALECVNCVGRVLHVLAFEMLRLKFSHLQAVARQQQQQRACECVVEAAALDVCTGSALTHLPGAVVIFISRVYALCCSFVCAAQACTLSRHACRFFPVWTTRSDVVRGGRFLCSFVREGVFCCTVFPHVRLSLAPRLLVDLC